ncbi:hypothetical protein [Desertivibrio insolitus]|uniref:hypothetical protein n=1 Tax=Herbiconiux sp. SYSU D00978 TaxID=2812562 RepID=UPI001A97C0CC|nr:hypothetical protein [Herbiconiux sp. SYSU D00978]
MRHVTIADKSLLIGDEAAAALLQYAALMGKLGSSDVVELSAIGADGETVEASFLLNSGTVLMVESSRSKLPEPDNDASTAYMNDRLAFYSADPQTMGYPQVDDDEDQAS